MALKDGTPEDFSAAAIRHLLDAEQLNSVGSHDNAGHLIGFAAECAIKHRVYNLQPGQDCPNEHLPYLLPAARKRLGTRSNYAAMYNLLKGDIFGDWAIDHRYATTGKISEQQFLNWLGITKRLFAAASIRRHQQ